MKWRRDKREVGSDCYQVYWGEHNRVSLPRHSDEYSFSRETDTRMDVVAPHKVFHATLF